MRLLPVVDKWSGFAVFLANLIEKYVSELDIDSLPDPIPNDKVSVNYDSGKNIHIERIETPMKV